MKKSRNDSNQIEKNKENLQIEMKKINKSVNKLRINELLTRMNEKTIKNEEIFIQTQSIFDFYQKEKGNLKEKNLNKEDIIRSYKKKNSDSNQIKDDKFYMKQKEYEYIKQMKINHKKNMKRQVNSNENQIYIKKTKFSDESSLQKKSPLLYKRLDKIISNRKAKQEGLKQMYYMIDMIKSETEKEEASNKLNKFKTMSDYSYINSRYDQEKSMKSRNIDDNQKEDYDYKYNSSYSVVNNRIQEEHSFIPTINQKSENLVKKIFPDGSNFSSRVKIYKSIKEINLDRINKENQSVFIPITTSSLPSYVRHSNINSYRINRSQLCEIVYYDNETEKISKKDEKDLKFPRQTITINDGKKGVYNKKPIKSKVFNMNIYKKIEKEGKGMKKKKEEMENSELKSTIYKSSYDLNIRDNTFNDEAWNVVVGNEKYLNVIKSLDRRVYV